jgi:hypothetical protein
VLDTLLGVESGRIFLARAPLAVIAGLPGLGEEALARLAERRARGLEAVDLLAFAGELSGHRRPARPRGLSSSAHSATQLGRMIRRGRRLTIGIGIGRESVRAVALRAGRIAWALERPRGAEPLARTIEQILADAPVARWRRPRVIAAVGPAHAQTKRLVGLPPVSGREQLAEIVRASASRFFLRNGVPLVTTWRRCEDGTPWGAAVEQPVLDAVESACRARRVKLTAIVPTVSVLGRVADGATGGNVFWRDGEVCVELAFESGELMTVRRTSAPTSAATVQNAQFAALDVLGPDGSRFADALGAARSRPEAILAWRDRPDLGARTGPRWRLVLAVLAILLAGAAWLAAPGVTARFLEQSARTRLAKLAPLRRDVTFAEREFNKLTGALAEVAAFDGARYAMTPLLADLTRALPDESALVTLRLARNEGNLVAVTPRAAAVLTTLEAIPGIDAAEIMGPVTREVLGGKTLERVTVRFRVNPTPRRSDGASSGSGA